MQIYYQSSSYIRFTILTESGATDADVIDGIYQVFATITRLSDGAVIISNENAYRENVGVYRITLSQSETAVPAKYKISWTYTVSGVTSTSVSHFDIVIPYAKPSDVRSMFPELSSKSDEEIQRKEFLARSIIDTICNQRFSFEIGKTISVPGRGKDTLYLPERIWELDSVTTDGEDITNLVEIFDDYWIAVKDEDPSLSTTQRFFNGGFFVNGRIYKVTGNWGWEYVPEEISRAAMLLIKDYFTDDYILRQHGIIQANIGDESYRFKDDGWLSSGNIDVDMLLSNYTRFRIDVV